MGDIPVGPIGRIRSGDDAGTFVRVVDDAEQSGGYLVLTGADPEFRTDASDDWVESSGDLRSYFDESGWDIEWGVSDGGREPRVPPVAPEELDERGRAVLESLRRPDGSDLRIFATLAHHPKLLKRWSAFGGTLLYGGELPPRDREVLILRTGWRCAAEYEWGQHVEIAKAVGLTDEDIARIAGPVDADGWPGHDRLLVVAADELHDAARLSDETWATLAEHYDVKQLIEICMVVGQYHLVAFTLNSLGVVPEDGLDPLPG